MCPYVSLVYKLLTADNNLKLVSVKCVLLFGVYSLSVNAFCFTEKCFSAQIHNDAINRGCDSTAEHTDCFFLMACFVSLLLYKFGFLHKVETSFK